jgi:protein tyrosine/serine phosphatase
MEEITEEYLLTRAQEVITLGNQFLKVFDRFNEDMKPYEENVSALMEVDSRFMNMEKEFKLLTQRLIIR